MSEQNEQDFTKRPKSEIAAVLRAVEAEMAALSHEEQHTIITDSRFVERGGFSRAEALAFAGFALSTVQGTLASQPGPIAILTVQHLLDVAQHVAHLGLSEAGSKGREPAVDNPLRSEAFVRELARVTAALIKTEESHLQDVLSTARAEALLSVEPAGATTH